MKYKKIMALALSACMMLACTSALGEGIIGSISGVKEGGDIMAADQGRLAKRPFRRAGRYSSRAIRR